MKEPVKTSLLISTYNWPEALDLCFQSVMKQSVLPDEIIVADDGSTEATRNLILDFQTKTDMSIQHIWHEDIGFQLSQIRNKAIAKAKNPYIIQIDGDVILNPHFIEDHIALASPETFVTGSRVNLSQLFSENLLLSHELPSFTVIRKNSRNFFNGLRLPFLTNFLSTRYKTTGKYRDFTRGCNMAFWKEDIIRVNGYNENMTGWGSEDRELVARMANIGLKKKFIKFAGIVYHIWHPFASREQETINDRIYEQTVNKQITTIPNGIDKYLK
ncbi:glycosyltransferase family 2 protein [Sphingobacterium lumbrici]|uniref:glycosyltransferase family 2 protein n=1 Tax=Sphingobacterium lumbrici TaxID=2559600 RepID=UPI0011261BCC|nr:glycosyltransferase family 2 protein [Sphingobacterium lumbrici]